MGNCLAGETPVPRVSELDRFWLREYREVGASGTEFLVGQVAGGEIVERQARLIFRPNRLSYALVVCAVRAWWAGGRWRDLVPPYNLRSVVVGRRE